MDKRNTYKHIGFEAQYDGVNYYFTLRDITSFKKQEKDYTNSVNMFNDLFTLVTEGCGISEAKLKSLGEPFYTTKERGTGLGLMVSYKIIKEHSGKIEVNSKEGVGTSFLIKFPCRCEMNHR